MRKFVVIAALIAPFTASCGGPCKQIAADRRALLARTGPVTAAPHARIQIPFAVANSLIAAALDPPPELPLPLQQIGTFGPWLGQVRAIPRSIVVSAGPPGRVHAEIQLAIVDRTGELFALRAQGDFAPILERTNGSTNDRLAIALDLAQIDRVEPELGPRVTEQLGRLLEGRVRGWMRGHMPRAALDAVAETIVEQAIQRGYPLVRKVLLPRLRERTRIGLELPDLPIARVELASAPHALALDLVTALPVRTGLADPPPPDTDAITVQIAGDTAVAAANWGIANGVLPQRYTRSGKPAAGGAYVPHFEWRASDPERPLVVHMFRLHGSCAHFTVGLLPVVEVRDGRARAWTANRQLEGADATLAFELLARTKALVDRTTSSARSAPASLRFTAGDRAVATRLLRASVTARELRVALAVSIEAERGMTRACPSRTTMPSSSVPALAATPPRSVSASSKSKPPSSSANTWAACAST